MTAPAPVIDVFIGPDVEGWHLYFAVSRESEIWVSQELNRCWSRFVVCKEAMHLMLDDSPSRYARSATSQMQDAMDLYWPKHP